MLIAAVKEMFAGKLQLRRPDHKSIRKYGSTGVVGRGGEGKTRDRLALQRLLASAGKPRQVLYRLLRFCLDETWHLPIVPKIARVKSCNVRGIVVHVRVSNVLFTDCLLPSDSAVCRLQWQHVQLWSSCATIRPVSGNPPRPCWMLTHCAVRLAQYGLRSYCCSRITQARPQRRIAPRSCDT